MQYDVVPFEQLLAQCGRRGSGRRCWSLCYVFPRKDSQFNIESLRSFLEPDRQAETQCGLLMEAFKMVSIFIFALLSANSLSLAGFYRGIKALSATGASIGVAKEYSKKLSCYSIVKLQNLQDANYLNNQINKHLMSANY